ncbi:UDP-N-acetylmuramate dehydrogenase [Vibrio sp. T187]|uniref:UDP-N-acetylmuramate dehydrogenase n=1 Tax=Vibrio TaxID=662 RepID=UPI0010C97D73|nr:MULTISPECIES: UDP-N-acetylmuramate dehydrogenase [Vibrio]MBW3697261.1 UDP-N-acetylmuramate dehydrogenase [Vibrio sp. T187]
MQFNPQANLQPFHTFGIKQNCDYLVEVSTTQELVDIYQNSDWAGIPKLILGKGSNILFTEPFKGLVIVNRITGKTLTETDEHYQIRVNAGEDWPCLVEWSIENSIGGLENLAMIPGCAGSAPIQNIGAYGKEFKDVCEYVDFLCLQSLEIKRLSLEECQFGYRDSIFKNALYEKGIVVAIGLKLMKCWQPCNHYGPLQSLTGAELTPRGVFEAVCDIRTSKLPDPKQQGNAGSFFKNPEIDVDQFDRLQTQFPSIVGYPSNGMIKVAAGWLIDQCEFKGVTVGGAQVHPKQALVLVNYKDATADDVIKLAKSVRDAVFERYQITLEHEVRFMGATAETNLTCITEKMS